MGKNVFLFMLLVHLFTQISFAQDQMYHLTISGGVGVSSGLKYVRQPAISGKIFAEKLFDEDNRKYFYIAFEYSRLNAAAPITKSFSNSNSITITYTYKSAQLITLTGGGKRILDNNIFYGVDMGLGIFTQGVPSRYYSDPLLNYVQYKQGNGGWGIASTAQFGYLLQKFHISLNYQGCWLPFRTVDLSNKDDVDLSSFALVTGVSVGYSF